MRICVYMERCNFVENIDIEDKSIPQELCNPIPALTFSKSVINGTFIICLLWILVLCIVNLIMTKVIFYLRKQTHPQFSFGSTPNFCSPNTHNLSRWRFHGFRSMELSTRLTVVSNGSNSIRVTKTPFTAHIASNFYLCGQLSGAFPISWFNLTLFFKKYGNKQMQAYVAGNTGPSIEPNKRLYPYNCWSFAVEFNH